MEFIEEFTMPLRCNSCDELFMAELDTSSKPWTGPAYCPRCKEENLIRSLVIRRVEPSRLYLGGQVR
jgi:phage FluMu protein Com